MGNMDGETQTTITVWRVQLERGVAEHDVKGLLSIDETCLRFVEETGVDHRIELTQVRRVRKLVGTPVVSLPVTPPSVLASSTSGLELDPTPSSALVDEPELESPSSPAE